MSKIEKRLAVVVPTKDRPQELRNLLLSIKEQELWPAQLIIVDGGNQTLKEVIFDFNFFNPVYVLEKPASLPRQRNKGLNCLNGDIQVVAFFDDDIQLYPQAINKVMEFFSKTDENIAGVACNNLSETRIKTRFLEKLFFLGSDKVGVILPSGFQSKICSVDRDYHVQWLMGGATFWRRNIFNKYTFDEWFYGYAHCEDIDFSYRVSKQYGLVVLKDAAFIHNTKPIEKRYEYHLGLMQVANRAYFVKKHCDLSLFLCYWACLGLLLKNVFLAVTGCKLRYLLRACGIFIGMLMAFFHNIRVVKRIKS